MSPKIDRGRERAKAARRNAMADRSKKRARPRTQLKLDTSWQRIAVNALLLVVAVVGAGLQVLEVRHRVPGQQHLWLAAYIGVGVFAATTLFMRVRKRLAERAAARAS